VGGSLPDFQIASVSSFENEFRRPPVSGEDFFLKKVLAERMHRAEAVCFDMDYFKLSAVGFDMIEQFAGGVSVEISL